MEKHKLVRQAERRTWGWAVVILGSYVAIGNYFTLGFLALIGLT